MKVMPIGLIAVFAMGLSSSAFCGEGAVDYQKLTGRYDGNMELYNVKRMLKFDYSVNVFRPDADKQEVSLKIKCTDCETRELTLSKCKVADPDATPVISFKCGGDAWHVDYQLDGEVLKGTGVTKKGFPYTINLKKTTGQ
jgi:hypothetical protein